MVGMTEILETWSAAISEDLSGLIGKEVRFCQPSVTAGERNELVTGLGSVVLTPCSVRDEAGSRLYFVTAPASAAVLAAARCSRPPDQIIELQAASLTGAVLDPFGEILDLCAGVLGRVLSESVDFPAVQLEESVQLDIPLPLDAPVPPGPYRRARFDVQIADYPDSSLDLLLEEALADAWFGPFQKGPGEEVGDRAIAVIDPVEADRRQIESMAEAVGRRVWVFDPRELGPHSFDDLSGFSAVIVAWDLGARPGLDVLESLLQDERTRHLAVALASEAPTAAMVTTALRWGARTFLHKPYDLGEVTRRLTALEADH